MMRVAVQTFREDLLICGAVTAGLAALAPFARLAPLLARLQPQHSAAAAPRRNPIMPRVMGIRRRSGLTLGVRDYG